ncbi:unnamed protein product [Protopolystoma xenopodis]|uniref:Uncharacterized protein n=1 Tax=Protopolystoma xenopodis TaxID=117903 RepID=A0A3S5BL42_9PLAT|nr:unnamed protein product [Protopolystoma xenopodis]
MQLGRAPPDMHAFVHIPNDADDVALLKRRIPLFFNTKVDIYADKLKLSGTSSQIDAAQVRPESISVIYLAADCVSLFHLDSLIRFFETLYGVILSVRHDGLLLLRGSLSANEKFSDDVKDLEHLVKISTGRLSDFKLESLAILCGHYGIAFTELVSCSDSLKMALFVFLSSARTEHKTVDLCSDSFIEVYKSNTPYPYKENQSPHTDKIPGPVIMSGSRAYGSGDEGQRKKHRPLYRTRSGSRIHAQIIANRESCSDSSPDLHESFKGKKDDIQANGEPITFTNKQNQKSFLRPVVLDGTNIAFQ